MYLFSVRWINYLFNNIRRTFLLLLNVSFLLVLLLTIVLTRLRHHGYDEWLSITCGLFQHPRSAPSKAKPSKRSYFPSFILANVKCERVGSPTTSTRPNWVEICGFPTFSTQLNRVEGVGSPTFYTLHRRSGEEVELESLGFGRGNVSESSMAKLSQKVLDLAVTKSNWKVFDSATATSFIRLWRRQVRWFSSQPWWPLHLAMMKPKLRSFNFAMATSLIRPWRCQVVNFLT